MNYLFFIITHPVKTTFSDEIFKKEPICSPDYSLYDYSILYERINFFDWLRTQDICKSYEITEVEKQKLQHVQDKFEQMNISKDSKEKIILFVTLIKVNLSSSMLSELPFDSSCTHNLRKCLILCIDYLIYVSEIMTTNSFTHLIDELFFEKLDSYLKYLKHIVYNKKMAFIQLLQNKNPCSHYQGDSVNEYCKSCSKKDLKANYLIELASTVIQDSAEIIEETEYFTERDQFDESDFDSLPVILTQEMRRSMLLNERANASSNLNLNSNSQIDCNIGSNSDLHMLDNSESTIDLDSEWVIINDSHYE